MALQRVRLQPQPHAGEGNQNPVTTGNCACADQNVRCVRAVFGGGLIDGASRDSIESGAFCFSKRYLAARSAAGRPRKDDKWFCACGFEWNTIDTGGICPSLPAP